MDLWFKERCKSVERVSGSGANPSAEESHGSPDVWKKCEKAFWRSGLFINSWTKNVHSVFWNLRKRFFKGKKSAHAFNKTYFYCELVTRVLWTKIEKNP
jgi:hypothetical protein